MNAMRQTPFHLSGSDSQIVEKDILRVLKDLEEIDKRQEP
jgi:hypothetical protein